MLTYPEVASSWLPEVAVYERSCDTAAKKCLPLQVENFELRLIRLEVTEQVTYRFFIQGKPDFHTYSFSATDRMGFLLGWAW